MTEFSFRRKGHLFTIYSKTRQKRIHNYKKTSLYDTLCTNVVYVVKYIHEKSQMPPKRVSNVWKKHTEQIASKLDFPFQTCILKVSSHFTSLSSKNKSFSYLPRHSEVLPLIQKLNLALVRHLITSLSYLLLDGVCFCECARGFASQWAWSNGDFKKDPIEQK